MNKKIKNTIIKYYLFIYSKYILILFVKLFLKKCYTWCYTKYEEYKYDKRQ